MNDKMSLSYLSVVDARIEVIGTSIPDDAPIPIIGMKEIMEEKLFHRTPGDGLSYPSKSVRRDPLHGRISVGEVDTGTKREYAYMCMHSFTPDGNAYNGVGLVYFRGIIPVLFLESDTFKEMMERVHNDHLKWLKETVSIDRETFLLQSRSYDSDKSLNNVLLGKMVKVLCDKYAIGQWKFYMCSGSFPCFWTSSTFNEKMEIVYDAHYDWLEAQPSIDHLSHKKWMKAYQTDPFMDYHWRIVLKVVIDDKLERFVQTAKDNTFIDGHQDAAIRYSRKAHPLCTQPDKSVVPFFLW
jgi:hypothetical protein